MKFDKDGKFIKTWGKKGMGPGEFDVVHTLAFDSRGGCSSATVRTTASRSSTRTASSSPSGSSSAGRAGSTSTRTTDTLYVADSESRDARTNTGQFGLPQTGYGYNLGARRGIRIGSARDGSVKFFIPDPCPYPYAAGSSLAEGVTVDREGNVYGADFLTDVRKFVKR